MKNFLAFLTFCICLGLTMEAQAVETDFSQISAPGFWDPRRRPERPDLSRLTTVRFLTDEDYPPFHFRLADGRPAGFNVDLAQMICDELKLNCTIQSRRWDTLVPALQDNKADVVAASLVISEKSRQNMDFSDAYYRTPARFVVRRGTPEYVPTPELLEGKSVGVVSGSAHANYLRTFFTGARVHGYETQDQLHAALRAGDVELIFADAMTSAVWLASAGADSCCVFRGGIFTESRWFGEGVGLGLRKGQDTLRLAINHALFKIWESGRYNELWLRYFPVSPY